MFQLSLEQGYIISFNKVTAYGFNEFSPSSGWDFSVHNPALQGMNTGGSLSKHKVAAV
jgi:hypothetical protein